MSFTKSNNKGFTLLEIMIVIAIIGILAAIAIPQFRAYRQRAYNSMAYSDAKNFYKACVMAAMATEGTVQYDSENLPPGYTGMRPKSGLFRSSGGHHPALSCDVDFKHTHGTKTYHINDEGKISESN